MHSKPQNVLFQYIPMQGDVYVLIYPLFTIYIFFQLRKKKACALPTPAETLQKITSSFDPNILHVYFPAFSAVTLGMWSVKLLLTVSLHS